MSGGDLDEQDDEIEALKSILNIHEPEQDEECLFILHDGLLDRTDSPGGDAGCSTSHARSGCLRIRVDIPDTPHHQQRLNVKAKTISINSEFAYEVSDEDWHVDFEVEHLPPIELNFRLPLTYPSRDPPEFFLAAPWLSTSQTNALRKRLEDIWIENEHCVILYLWYSALKVETFSILEIQNNVMDITAKLEEDCEKQTRDMILANSLAQAEAENVSVLVQNDPSAGPSGVNFTSGTELENTTISETPEETVYGQLARWNAKKKFGFIKDDRSKEEYFAHLKEFMGNHTPHKGDWLEFHIRVPTRKGIKSKPEATHIRALDPEDLAINRKSVINAPKRAVESNTEHQEPSEDASKPAEHNPINTPTVKLTFDSGIVSLLKSFDEAERDRQFSKATFECLVCFSEKFGSKCLRFVQCKHVYCKACMTQHFTVRIQEGCYSSITCPNEGCESTALPNQIKELLPEDVFERYESKLLETTLETMSDVLPCPLLHCQCPTLIDRENNMGRCPRCSHTFCIYCKAAFHGVEPCKMKSQENLKIIRMYREANPAGKAILEKRYGKKQLTVMMNEFQSLTYLEDNTKRCPKCGTPIQKSEGCNKMTCNKCNTHFCYICGEKISHVNPYTHFNVAGSNCAGRLFEGITQDEMVRFEDLLFDDDIEEDEGDSEDDLNDYVLFAL